MIVFLAVIAIGLSAALTYMLTRPKSVLRVLDYPNKRSLHGKPILSGGGIAILAAFYVCNSIISLRYYSGYVESFWLFVGSIALAIISYRDDRQGVKKVYRLIVHFLAASCLVVGGIVPGFFVFTAIHKFARLPVWNGLAYKLV